MQKITFLCVAAIGLLSSAAQAQGPTAPSRVWGIEAVNNVSGGSLLRFRSSQSAWLLGVNASYTENQVETVNPITGASSTTTQDNLSTRLEVGLRRYSNPATSLRSFTTVSGLVASIGVPWGRAGATARAPNTAGPTSSISI